MRRFISTIGLILCVSAIGCASTERLEPIVLGTPAMLFDGDASGYASTDFGRSPWPAAYNGIESVQETVFVESYYDYQGNATQERNNPRRWFRSYRIGTQVR